MKLKECAVLLAMLVILFTPKVYADDPIVDDTEIHNPIAEYVIEYKSYDPDMQVYTADVYLNTSEYLTTGTFGMKYDASAVPVFEIDTQNFAEFQEFPNNGQNYKVFQWYLYEESEETKGKIHMGTITIENVALNDKEIPAGWHTETLRCLDWYETPESKEDKFTNTDDDVCLNDEIYKKYADGCEFYQGYDMEDIINPKWVDIGFRFDSGYELPERSGNIISGVVHSYNPNNAVTAALVDEEGKEVGSVTAGTTDRQPNGRVSSMYELVIETNPGTYTLEIRKAVHLTYKMEIVIGNKDISVGDVTLYCGDINADEKIKLNDRTELIYSLNQQSSVEPLVWDLNGDGKVTIFDLNIMKLYYNRSYGEVASYVEK